MENKDEIYLTQKAINIGKKEIKVKPQKEAECFCKDIHRGKCPPPSDWKKELEMRLRLLIIKGYDMGKSQTKTPYNYTCDTDVAEEVYIFIEQLLEEQFKDHLRILEESKKMSFEQGWKRGQAEQRSEIKSDLLTMADKGEMEELRREVENYFNIIKK